jgi:hypothetical protein
MCSPDFIKEFNDYCVREIPLKREAALTRYEIASDAGSVTLPRIPLFTEDLGSGKIWGQSIFRD